MGVNVRELSETRAIIQSELCKAISAHPFLRLGQTGEQSSLTKYHSPGHWWCWSASLGAREPEQSVIKGSMRVPEGLSGTPGCLRSVPGSGPSADMSYEKAWQLRALGPGGPSSRWYSSVVIA